MAEPGRKPVFWMVVGGAIVFVATNFFGEPIKQFGGDLYSSYRDQQDAPSAFVCAPLQEARAIVRQGDNIIHDGKIGHPAPVTLAFSSNATSLKDLSLLVYPLGSHSQNPKLYFASVESSDLTNGNELKMSVDNGEIKIDIPEMPPNEMVILEATYGQPVTIILEARAVDYADEFHGIAGCPSVAESFSTPPALLVAKFFPEDCPGGDCEVESYSYEFTLEENGELPVIEQWIVVRGEKQWFQPSQNEGE